MAETAETLKEAAFKQVAECKRSLGEGNAGLSGLEESVRAYCEAVALLPKGEGKLHARELEALRQQMTALREELTLAHEAVRRELTGLSLLKQANVAYQKSDAIGPVHKPKKEDE